MMLGQRAILRFRKSIDIYSYCDRKTKFEIESFGDVASLLKENMLAQQIWVKLEPAKQQSYIEAFLAQLSKAEESKKMAHLMSSLTYKEISQCETEVQIGLKILRNHFSAKIKTTQVSASNKYFFQPFENILSIYDHRNIFLVATKYVALALRSGNPIILRPCSYGILPTQQLCAVWNSICPEIPMIRCINDAFEPTNTQSPVSELLGSSRVGFINFAGRLQQGLDFHYIMSAKSEVFTQNQFLLTSSDSAFVMEGLSHTQITKAARILARGAFSNAGSNFNSVKRIYIARSIADLFSAEFIEASKQYSMKFSVEDKVNLGKLAPILLKQEFAEAQIHLQSFAALPSEFKLLHGGKSHTETHKSGASCSFVEATIYKVETDKPSLQFQDLQLMFPVCFLTVVDSVQSSIRLMNSSAMGITASLFTTDTRLEIIESVGKQLDVGTVNVNTWEITDGITYSARKRSGKGFSFSPLSYNNITRTKAISY